MTTKIQGNMTTLEFTSLADMKASTPTYAGQTCLLSAGWRSGILEYLVGDYSAEVAADPLEGVYVKVDGVAATVGVRKRRLNGYVTPGMFGAVGSGLETSEVQAWINFCNSNGLIASNDMDVTVGDISIPSGLTFYGTGSISGTTTGAKPVVSALRATNSSGRLALLTAYYDATATLAAPCVISGSLNLRNMLTVSTLSTQLKNCSLELENCACHGAGFRSDKRSELTAPELIVSDSSGVGLHTFQGGTIVSEDAIIVGSVSRGVYTQNGGVISIGAANVVDGADEGIFMLYGGSVIAPGANIDSNAANGILVNYGGDVNASGASVTNNGESGATCESNGSIFLKNGVITGNGTQGVQTVFGGFIQAGDSTLTGNGTFAAQANDSGVIQVSGATIDNTNNSGGTALRASGSGTIIDDEGPGGAGKTTLTNSNYSPGYNRFGNGAAYIGSGSQNNAEVSTPTQLLGSPVQVTISAGSITVDRSYVTVDTEGNAASDDLDTINGGYIGMRVILEAENSGRTVLVKDGTGNISLSGSADFPLTHANDKLELILNRNLVWNSIGPGSDNEA